MGKGSKMAVAVVERKLADIEKQLKSLNDFVDTFSDDKKDVVAVKIGHFERLYKKYEDIKEEAFKLSDNDFEEFEPKIASCNERFESLEVGLNALNIKNKNVLNVESSNVKSYPRLPELALPQFNGDIELWFAFKEQFKEIIDNCGLNQKQKLQYLQSCLIGVAKNVITVDDTYDSLFLALEQRFENKRYIINKHITALLMLKHEKYKTDSVIDLRILVDTCTKHLRALKLLKIENNTFSELILIQVVMQVVDTETKRLFEMTLESSEIPNWDDFLAFLNKRCLFLETLQPAVTKGKQNFKEPPRPKNFVLHTDASVDKKCRLCPLNHDLYNCDKFKNMPVRERYDTVKSLNLCLKCLKPNHRVSDCKSKHTCFCKKNHNQLLHFVKEKTQQVQHSESSQPENWHQAAAFEPVSFQNSGITNRQNKTDRNSFNFTGAHNAGQGQITDNSGVNMSVSASQRQKSDIILSTCIVYIENSVGEKVPLRVLADSGSQVALLKSSAADFLNLRKLKTDMSVSGLGGSNVNIKSKVECVISNGSGSYSRVVDFHVVPKITNMIPVNSFDISHIVFPKDVYLADPTFNASNSIDALLSADIFFDILKGGKYKLDNGNLILQNTVFGYMVSGNTSGFSGGSLHCGLITKEFEILNDTLKSFWEVEEIVPTKFVSDELKKCDEHFLKTTIRDTDGRFCVEMPMTDKDIELGESKSTAIRRFKSLEKRLVREPDIKDKYVEFLKEYEDLGHMQKVTDEVPGLHYYIPHHAVIRPESKTTKLRVVFDASCKSSNGKSLNDILLKGGTIQPDLFDILLRFRKHVVAFSSDIKKMFRQVKIHEHQKDLLRILWRQSPEEDIECFSLSTVTYGTKPAPYLATRCLLQLAHEGKNKYPLASPVIQNSTYMDDILSGADDITVAKVMQHQLIELMKEGCFHLYKWSSNSEELLKDVPTENKECVFSENDDLVKTLGLSWRPREDTFFYQMNLQEVPVTITKRTVLSFISKLYDPLGLLQPIIIKAKMMIQKIWLLKIDWDQNLPGQEIENFHRYVAELQQLKDIKIPRCILLKDSTVVQLIGFADASAQAYGACLYVKSENSVETQVRLLCSKTRVAPLKTLSIPRLELLAATLLSKLASKIVQIIDLKFDEIHLYSDSKVVLDWIQTQPYLLKVFVANRVSLIQELTQTFSWHHVKTKDNPADLISRGATKLQLQDELWWTGPSFLMDTNVNSNSVVSQKEDTFFEELKHPNDFLNPDIVHSLVTHTVPSLFINNCLDITNSYTKLVRIISYVFRFYHNCKNPVTKVSGVLTTQELERTRDALVKVVQWECFGEEIKCLAAGKDIPKTSKLKFLNVFLDGKGLLRVGGRLVNADVSFDCKFPFVLPHTHNFSKLIMLYYHLKNLHVGPQALLSFVRQKFWILNGRSLARKITHECVACFKIKPKLCEQLMGSLPSERVNQDFVFNCTGIDFLGPFYIKYKGQRKGVYHKIYVTIFVCFVTRATHFEIITDLTTGAFIATLKRFFSRRGISKTLFTDNAKTFVGAQRELKSLYQIVSNPNAELAAYYASENINWNFSPPRAPNFGGLWEAGVKSFKFHFKRVVGDAKLTFEEFSTVMNQVEAILNSRPICPLSNDPDDCEVLTPGHFLIGRPLNAIPEPMLIDLKSNRLDKWQRLTKMVQMIWSKWQRDYLSNLQQRTKWLFKQNNVNVGVLVLVKEDNMPTCKWCLGRIAEIIPGSDGLVRVVKVKIKGKILKRSISSIAILPIASSIPSV